MIAIQRLEAYARLVRLDRPIGIYLVLWPTLWALWLAADGLPPTDILLIFLAGTVLMRSAGCAINDFADRELDPQVSRTRARPLAAGEIRPGEAIAIFILLSLCALAVAWPLNRLALLLAIPALLLAASYPFAKRYTYLPQAHLGIAFAAGIPMAFAAVQNTVPLLAWQLVAVTIAWTIAYDSFYAMVDREDDLQAGAKSSAILFGRADRAITAALQAGVLLGLALIGWQTSAGVWFYLGLCVAAGYALYQQVLIRDREPAACFTAFLNNHRFGMAVFAGLLLDRL